MLSILPGLIEAVDRDCSDDDDDGDYKHEDVGINQAAGKEVNKEYVKKKEEFEEEVQRQKERQLAKEKAALTSKLIKLINKQVKQVEPISEREWRKLVGMNNTIPDFEPMQTVSLERIQKSMMEGLPASLRGEIWCIVCHVKREKQMHAQDIYLKLIDLDNPEEEHRIQKDVTRTFSNYPVSGQECDQDASWNNQIGQQMLFNVLLAYANYDSQIGYVQGLNYIAAMLLMHIQEEENVFWCLIYLLNRKNWRRIYMEEMPKLMDLMDYIEQKLQTDFPEIAEHLEEQCFTVGAAFSPLFITLYIYQIEHQYAMRIFESFLLDGEDTLLRVLFQMLRLKGEKICELKEMELIQYLRTDLINECISQYGIRSLLEEQPK